METEKVHRAIRVVILSWKAHGEPIRILQTSKARDLMYTKNQVLSWTSYCTIARRATCTPDTSIVEAIQLNDQNIANELNITDAWFKIKVYSRNNGQGEYLKTCKALTFVLTTPSVIDSTEHQTI